MAIDVQLMGRTGTSYALFTPQGVLATAAPEFDLTAFKSLSATGTAYNFFEPKVGHCFIMKGMLAFATKDVNDSTDTIITVYESTAPDSTTASKTILQFGMGKLTVLPLVPLNALINEGAYLNAKTDDNTINMTIFGYYVPA